MDYDDIYKRLVERRWKLTRMTEFETGLYSRQWAALALGFDFIGDVHNAARCRSDAARYGEMAGTWRKVPTNSVTWLEYAGGA